MFLRYLKQQKGLEPPDKPLDEIDIRDVDAPLLKSVTLMDLYDYMSFLARERKPEHPQGAKPGIGNASTHHRLNGLAIAIQGVEN